MKSRRILITLCLSATSLLASAADIPGALPKPDGAPAKAGKVKVYILAGQSNMVGMGQIEPANPHYPSIYLCADPMARPCRMPVGPSALLPHGVYQTAAQDAPAGALVSVYAGAYDAKTDYNKLKPVKETVVALGTATESLPSIDGPHTLVARAFLDVPISGTYEIRPGFANSRYAVATLDGKEVYRREVGGKPAVQTVNLKQGMRYPLTIAYAQGGSAALWLKLTGLKGKGDLTTVTDNGNFAWLADGQGGWTQRNDVTYCDVRLYKPEEGIKGVPLSPLCNGGGKTIGPEVTFGYVLGEYHDEHVLIIESSIGNRSIAFDFRPPSSGREDPDNEWEGKEYRLMAEGTRKVLASIGDYVPGYQGQGYEIMGFVWFQGHKDGGSPKDVYEKHLVNLINDVRQEFQAPDMRVTVATVGFDGEKMAMKWLGIHSAQMAVSDPAQHPDYAGTVASVDTRSFWKPVSESPANADFHYNLNAEFYALTGDALGREMVKLLGGTAEPVALPAVEEKLTSEAERVFSNEIIQTFDERLQEKYDVRSENPTAEEYARMAPMLRPMILDDMLAPLLENMTAERPPHELRKLLPLIPIVTGEKPQRGGFSGESYLDRLIELYQAAGIHDYDWREVLPGMKTATWQYFSFDPPEKQPLEKSDRFRKVTFPQGMENWNQPDFDAAAAGWKEGKAPFAQLDGKLMPISNKPPVRYIDGKIEPKECYMPLCGCDQPPNTLWEKEVLLMRQTFDLPPAKEGHAYRVLLGGAGCDRTGEGYAVYINGKLAAQHKGGFFRNPGIRCDYIANDVLPELRQGGKVTIAVINFLRYTHHGNVHVLGDGTVIPPNGYVDLTLQEAKLPAAAVAAVERIGKE